MPWPSLRFFGGSTYQDGYFSCGRTILPVFLFFFHIFCRNERLDREQIERGWRGCFSDRSESCIDHMCVLCRYCVHQWRRALSQPAPAGGHNLQYSEGAGQQVRGWSARKGLPKSHHKIWQLHFFAHSKHSGKGETGQESLSKETLVGSGFGPEEAGFVTAGALDDT